MAPPRRLVVLHTGSSWTTVGTWRSAFSAILHHRRRRRAACCCERTRSPYCMLLRPGLWISYTLAHCWLDRERPWRFKIDSRQIRSVLVARCLARPPQRHHHPNLSRIGLLALHVSRISVQLGPTASITHIIHPRLSHLVATEVEYSGPKIQIYTGQDPNRPNAQLPCSREASTSLSRW